MPVSYGGHYWIKSWNQASFVSVPILSSSIISHLPFVYSHKESVMSRFFYKVCKCCSSAKDVFSLACPLGNILQNSPQVSVTSSIMPPLPPQVELKAFFSLAHVTPYLGLYFSVYYCYNYGSHICLSH